MVIVRNCLARFASKTKGTLARTIYRNRHAPTMIKNTDLGAALFAGIVAAVLASYYGVTRWRTLTKIIVGVALADAVWQQVVWEWTFQDKESERNGASVHA